MLPDRKILASMLRRDLGAIRRSKALMLPMVLLPTVLLIGLPAALGLAATRGRVDIERLMEFLPERFMDGIADQPPDEQLILLILGYLVAPLFLVVPLMVSAVTASDTFAGERERRTLESLLHLPIGDRELYLSKLAAGFLPAVAVSWFGFIGFAFVSNVVCWPVMGRVFIPTPLWLVLVLWVAPAVAALGLGVMVMVSTRVTTTQEAQQLGGAVVLPVVMLVVSQTTAVMLWGIVPTVIAGAVVWVVAILLNVRGARAFTRDRIASRL